MILMVTYDLARVLQGIDKYLERFIIVATYALYRSTSETLAG